MERPKRKTTVVGFNMGYILMATAIFLVVFGMFRGIVTESNVSEILWALLIPAAGFFGIVTTRAGASEIATINAAANAATNPPVENTTVENNGDSVSVITDTPPSMSMPEEDKNTSGRR